MTNNNVGESWREDLRDLYLNESPDKDGALLGSILTSYGHFKFTQTTPTAEFYLASKKSVEDFIEHTLEAQLDDLEKEIKEKFGKDIIELPDDEIYDQFDLGYSSSIVKVLALLQSKRTKILP